MDALVEILAALGPALALVGVGHEMGHVNEADRLNTPISFDSKMRWDARAKSKSDLASISNAGLVMQGKVTKATEGSGIDKYAKIVSAINNIGYALKPSGIMGGTGDVKMIEQTKGKKARQTAQAALIASGISDLYQALGKKKSNHSLSYGQSSDGTPMAIYGRKF